jgi:hypothetical protein
MTPLSQLILQKDQKEEDAKGGDAQEVSVNWNRP